MPNRFSVGCGCCETGNRLQSQGAATVLWKAPPCPDSNRIGVDITIQNLSDCTDYAGFFGFNCGTCTRTFSNLNGTYYAPVIIETTPGGRAFADGASTEGQPIIDTILGQWYTGSSSCSSSPSNGSCTEPSAYPYFKVEALLDCDGSGLFFPNLSHVLIYLCTEDGTPHGAPSASTSAAGSFVEATMRPDCCTVGKVTAPVGSCCNIGPRSISCTADSQGTTANKVKYEWVTA